MCRVGLVQNYSHYKRRKKKHVLKEKQKNIRLQLKKDTYILYRKITKLKTQKHLAQ